MKYASLVPFTLSFAVAAAALAVSPQSRATAAELKVASAAGLTPVVKQIATEFERSSGHKVVIRSAASEALAKQIEGGETFDVAILTQVRLDGLIKAGKIAADTRTKVALSGTGVAVKAGATKPDIGTAEAFKTAMLEAKTITYAQAGAIGPHLVRVFQRLKIAKEMAPKTKLQPDLKGVIQAVANGDADFGFAAANLLVSARGIELIGPLASELQNYVTFVAGIAADAAELDAAKEFVKALTAESAAQALKAKGMEPGSN